MLTTQFFAMKIQRYMSEHGISSATLAEVAAKAFRNGALNPNAWRRRPLTANEILASKMVSHPRGRRGGAGAGPGRAAARLFPPAGAAALGGAPHPLVRLI
jgi:acetyl-CoA acyltransferase